MLTPLRCDNCNEPLTFEQVHGQEPFLCPSCSDTQNNDVLDYGDVVDAIEYRHSDR